MPTASATMVPIFRKVVARREHQPDRKAGRDRAVQDQRPRQLCACQREERPPRRAFGHGLPEDQRSHQQHDADDRCFADMPGADEAHVHAHDQRDRDRCRDGEQSPRTAGERLDDDQAQHREDDDHDREHADQRQRAGNRTQLHLDHLAERLAVAAYRSEQHDEVLHRAGDDDAGQDPQRSGQVAHLRGEDRADQRTGAGDRREMMTVEDDLVGRDVILAVVVSYRRRRPAVVEHQDFFGDELAVEPVGDEIDAQRSSHQPHRVDRFAPPQRQRGKAAGADDCNQNPRRAGCKQIHGISLDVNGDRRTAGVRRWIIEAARLRISSLPPQHFRTSRKSTRPTRTIGLPPKA